MGDLLYVNVVRGGKVETVFVERIQLAYLLVDMTRKTG